MSRPVRYERSLRPPPATLLGLALARSTLRKALLAVSHATGTMLDVDALIVDQPPAGRGCPAGAQTFIGLPRALSHLQLHLSACIRVHLWSDPLN